MYPKIKGPTQTSSNTFQFLQFSQQKTSLSDRNEDFESGSENVFYIHLTTERRTENVPFTKLFICQLEPKTETDKSILI